MDQQPEAMRPWFPLERQLIESSVWEADYPVRILWVTLLAIAAEPGRQGVIDMTIGSLAGRAHMSLDDTRAALGVLLAPDPSSRNPEHEGRRVEKIDSHRDWGWRLLNWQERKEAHKRAIETAKKRRQREAQRILNELRATSGTQAGHSGTGGDALSREIEKEREKEKEKEPERETAEGGGRPERGTPRAASKVGPTGGPTEEEWVLYAGATWPDWPDHNVRSAWGYYQARGWKNVKDWRASAKTCYHRHAAERPAPAALTRTRVAPFPPPEPDPPPDLVPIDQGEWFEIRMRLRPELDERDFETWLDPLRQVGKPNGRLTLWYPGEARFLPWLAEHFAAPITAAAREFGLPIPQGVEFRCS